MLAGLVGFLSFACLACSESRERAFGKYKVVEVDDGLFGAVCQPHQELFFDGKYLGSCGTPTGPFGPLPIPDHNCFAIADDGGSAVYWHTPGSCGLRAEGRAKPGGIYHHTPETGEELLHNNGSINRSFIAESVPGGGLFLGWPGSPSGDGRCNATLVLGADGHERTVRSTVPGCP